MKRIFSFLLLIVCYVSNAQTAEKIEYYYQGKKISFPANYDRLVISLTVSERLQSLLHQVAVALEVADTSLQQMADKRMLSSKMPKGQSAARVREKIANLGRLPFIRFVHPVFKSPSGKDMGYGDELVVKLKAATGIAAFEDFVKKSHCSIVKKYAFADKIYTISSGQVNNYDAAATANRFFESGLFEYAEPDLTLFDGLMAAPNDPLYNYQWSHNNTGSAIQYSGTTGVDMKVQQAWAITKGAGITIAVIDEGVDLIHPDLQANLLQGFDAISGTANAGDGKPLSPYNGHGTSCAGIIAALADNNIGTAGVAPESKIIPINVVNASGSFTSYTGLVAGFDYAWQHGADVISNSWGGGSPSQLLDGAITRAVTQGRSGKGSVVLFSSGNDNSVLSYPASNADVIAVGGASMCGQRKSPGSCDGEYWWGANYGVGLDVVAPCVKVATTDISGTGGYNAASGTDGNYFLTFNGTSSAAPNAAGVMALILAANNSLTLAQARNILEGSCAKLPGYAYAASAGQPNGTWNAETGYGLVDAYSAMQLARPLCAKPPVMITAPTDSTCNANTVRLSATANNGYTYQWLKDGVVITGATDSFYVVNKGGAYTVRAGKDGCDSLSRPFVFKQCQVLLNNNNPASFCDALFYDSGGRTGNYGNNESFTKTFYPSVAGSQVQLALDSIDLDTGDQLSVYDGAGITNILTTLSGKSSTRQFLISSLGALTVSFSSNASGTSRGWFGSIGCYQPFVYRSKTTGAYSNLNTWEVKTASGFVNAAKLPTAADDSIIIRAGHTVTFDQSLQLDQLLVETGAVLRVAKDLYLFDGPGNDLVVNGTIEIGSAIVSKAYTGTIQLNGNLVANTGAGNIIGKVDVAGSTLQTITLGSFMGIDWLNITNPSVTINLQGITTIDKIEVNNNGSVNVQGPYTLLVRVLTLTNGKMIIANNSLLNIMAPTQGTIIGGSESSFIEGPLRRNTGAQGADILFFPIGKEVYRPVWLNVTAPAGGFSSYQAQVFAGAPASRVLPASLNAVSNVRYYRLVNTGTQAPTAASILLTYGPDEGLPYDNSLRIAKDDGGGNWVDVGGNGSGNPIGNILSSINFSSFNDFVLATPQNSIPGCTSNTTPADGTGISTSSTAVLGWNAVINATSYDVFIWTGATAPSLPTVTVTTTSYNATGLTGSTAYNWYVRPKNASGYIETLCGVNKTTFFTAAGAAPPSCVVNTSPANGTTLISQTTARLTWQASANATSYDVYLATGNGVPTVLLTNVTGLTYYATNLLPGTLYSWYVAPRNADGANTACGGTIFKTTFTTAIATGGGNLSPVANAGVDNAITLPVNLVTLDGSASYDPDGRIVEYYWYQIQGTAATISNPFSMTPVISGLTTAGNYIIGLQVKDNNGITAYSQTTITVNPAVTTLPGCATNSYPANGVTFSTRNAITLIWGVVNNATSYDVYLWTGATAPSTPTASNVIGTSYDATGLTASTLYNWFVVPKSAGGPATGCSANATTFTIDGPGVPPACVINTKPIIGGTLLTQTTARLVWPASSSATSYDVYLAAGNAVPTVLLGNTTALTYYATNLTPGTLYSWYIAPRNAAGANTACAATNKTTFTTAVATGVGNLAPVANAGFNAYIPQPASSLLLDGSGSYDPDGRIVEHYWYQLQGPVTASISSNFSTFPNITGLTSLGNYVFGLQVKDDNGVTAYSQVTVTVAPAITILPTCATNSYPANGTTLSTRNAITLIWGSVEKATLYDVYLWTGATAPLTPTASNVTGTSYDATGLMASTLYSWYVVPKNPGGPATGCSANATTFTIDGPGVVPACVVNTSPKIGSTLITQTTARLVWPASSSATSYDVYLAAGNAVPTILVTNTTALTYYATGLTPGTLYSWYIAPRNTAGANTTCGATEKTNFTTAAATGGGNLAPVADAGINAFIILPTSSLLLDGSASYDPDGRIVEYYWYQIQGAPATISNPFSMTPTITGLTTAGNYTIGLQVKDNNGVTAYSQTTITVNSAGTAPVPTCVINTSPVAGTTLTTQHTATLTWPSSATAISYDVYLAAGTGTPATLVTNTTALTYSASGLTAGTLYSWYVAPRNASGANTGCGASNTTTFTTAAAITLPACVTNTFPVSGSTLPTQTSARLSWPASAGATSYDVYLAAGNAVPTLLVTNTTALTYYATGLTAGTLYSWYVAPGNDSGVNTACGITNRATFTTAAATGAGNISPVSNAGGNTSITLPVSTVTLDGSASYDPDGRIAEFYWYQIQTPVAVTISTPFSMTPTITGLTTAGNYIIGLQVKDNNGVTAYSQVTITVNAAGTTNNPALQNTSAPAEQTVTAPTSSPVITGRVSPNPVAPGRNARVQINSNRNGSVAINIVNVNGYIISTLKLNLVRGVNTTTIGTTSLAQGLYILNIAGGYKPLNLKLLVE